MIGSNTHQHLRQFPVELVQSSILPLEWTSTQLPEDPSLHRECIGAILIVIQPSVDSSYRSGEMNPYHASMSLVGMDNC